MTRRKGEAMRVCAVCGNAITGTHSNNRKYCSEQCRRIAEAQKRMNSIADRAKRVNYLAQAVYKAYGYQCAICHWRATEELISVKGKIQYAYGNEIHHITPISEGGTEMPDNIILLCPNHHKQADLGLIDRKELQQLTRSFELSEEQKADAIATCTDAISTLIFET